MPTPSGETTNEWNAWCQMRGAAARLSAVFEPPAGSLWRADAAAVADHLGAKGPRGAKLRALLADGEHEGDASDEDVFGAEDEELQLRLQDLEFL